MKNYIAIIEGPDSSFAKTEIKYKNNSVDIVKSELVREIKANSFPGVKAKLFEYTDNNVFLISEWVVDEMFVPVEQVDLRS